MTAISFLLVMKTIGAILALAVAANAQGFVRSKHRTSVVKSTPPHKLYAPEDLPTTYDVRDTLKSMGAQISTARNQHIP